MKNKNLLANTDLNNYDENQLKSAMNSLEQYMSLVQNNNRMFNSDKSEELTGEYNNLSLKRSSLINRKVRSALFNNVALTGSIFSNTNFIGALFDESNMQYCQFINNSIENVNILSTNLSYSNYYNNEFKNVVFKGSTVAEILFEKCVFDNCTFTSSMLENTVFSSCVFSHVIFENTNIEYTEFKNCTFKRLTIPMGQVPYVFGLLPIILENEENIILSADTQLVSTEEYLKLLNSFAIYYSSINEFFPLANIFMSSENTEKAFYYIEMGIEYAIKLRNFRMLKFFCKLAKTNNYIPYEKLRNLYLLIEKYVSEQTLNIYEQRSFIYNIGEIRSLLLENINDYPTVRIEMQTNIDSLESGKIQKFIDFIDSTINYTCTKKISHIEYRHNSNANFAAFISAHYSEIILTIYFLLLFSNNAIDSIQKKILTHKEIKLKELEIQEKERQKKEAEKKANTLKDDNISYNLKYIINDNDNNGDINIYI